jgi:hypothetical protein
MARCEQTCALEHEHRDEPRSTRGPSSDVLNDLLGQRVPFRIVEPCLRPHRRHQSDPGT